MQRGRPKLSKKQRQAGLTSGRLVGLVSGRHTIPGSMRTSCAPTQRQTGRKNAEFTPWHNVSNVRRDKPLLPLVGARSCVGDVGWGSILLSIKATSCARTSLITISICLRQQYWYGAINWHLLHSLLLWNYASRRYFRINTNGSLFFYSTCS